MNRHEYADLHAHIVTSYAHYGYLKGCYTIQPLCENGLLPRDVTIFTGGLLATAREYKEL
jgi:hypothetical protein